MYYRFVSAIIWLVSSACLAFAAYLIIDLIRISLSSDITAMAVLPFALIYMVLPLSLAVAPFYVTMQGFRHYFKQNEEKATKYFKTATYIFFYPLLVILAIALYANISLMYSKAEADTFIDNVVVERDKTDSSTLLLFTKNDYEAKNIHVKIEAITTSNVPLLYEHKISSLTHKPFKINVKNMKDSIKYVLSIELTSNSHNLANKTLNIYKNGDEVSIRNPIDDEKGK